jgi:ABC-type Fe3+-siderophore transport system permease subunit
MNDLARWVRAEWDRVAGVTLVVLGVILVAVGYNGVANSPYVAEELAYLASGAVGGLFLLGCGATLWLSADLHDEWRKLDRIEAAIRGDSAAVAAPEAEPADGTVNEINGSRRSRRIRVAASEGHASVALLGGLAVAATVMLVGWHRAAATGDARVAFTGLSISVAGVVVAAATVAAYTFWLRRSVSNRQVELLSPYLIADAATSMVNRAAATRGAGPVDDRVLVAAGLTHFHRPGCPAIYGVKATLTKRARVRAGMSPCGICGA